MEELIEQLKAYGHALTTSVKSDRIRHQRYEETVDYASELGVHVYGDMPTEILTARRPNETDEQYEYRIANYKKVSKSEFDRVFNILNKIFDPKLFSIQWPEFPAPLGNDFVDYLSKEYPRFRSLMDYEKMVVMRATLGDPNAVAAVLPLPVTNEMDYIRPFLRIFRSESVLDKEPGNYYALLDSEKSLIKSGGVEKYKGNIIHYVSKDYYAILTQTGEEYEQVYDVEIIRVYAQASPPAWELGGIVEDPEPPYVYQSLISGAVPHWNELTGIYSDLTVQYPAHMYLERVEISEDCEDCATLDKPNNLCNKCQGTGKKSPRGPLSTRIVKNPMEVGSDMIFPGVTYIDKPVEIIKLTEEKVERLKSEALSALSQEVADKVGEIQSGIAKQIDRQEQKTFFDKLTGVVFRTLNNAVVWTAFWRYSETWSNWAEFIPVIEPPNDYELATLAELTKELAQSKEAKISNAYTNGLEIEIANRRFGEGNEQAKRVRFIQRFDPLPGSTEDEKMARLMNGGISLKDYRLSCNIHKILNIATAQNPDFLDLQYDQKAVEVDRILTEITAQIEA